jgi:hypothetical protein
MLQKLKLLLVLVASLGAFTARGQDLPQNSSSQTQPQNWVMNGMNLQACGNYPYGSKDSCEEVRKLKREFRVNAVTVRKNEILPAYDSTALTTLPHDGATDQQITREFAQDRRLGVKSFFEMGLRLQTDLDAPDDQDDCAQNWRPWHGAIDYGKPSDYDSFFYQYGQKLLHYADLAKKSGNVSVFSIGHELFSLAETKPLKDPVEIRDYLNTLEWNLRTNGKEARAYAKEEISHLMSFNDSLQARDNPVIISATKPDTRTYTEKLRDSLKSTLKTDYAEAKAYLNRTLPPDDPSQDRADIQKWISGDSSAQLSQNAKNYLIQLENTRRAYLEGMWERLIDKVHAKFSDVPAQKRPLITFNGSATDQIGFWHKLDVISVSMYGSLGSVDKRDMTPIDDGKISVADLKSGWMRYVDHVQDPNPRHYDPLQTGFKQFMAGYPGKKMIFSELGFSQRKHSAQDSWLWQGCQTLEHPDGTKFTVHAMKRPLSNTERDNALEALRELIQDGKMPWLDGIAMWDAYTHPSSTDEYCVDCALAAGRALSSGPFDQAIANLFKNGSKVTNNYSNGDPCIPPKPKPKPLLKVVQNTPPSEDIGVPFLDLSDHGKAPLDFLNDLGFDPAPSPLALPQENPLGP